MNFRQLLPCNIRYMSLVLHWKFSCLQLFGVRWLQLMMVFNDGFPLRNSPHDVSESLIIHWFSKRAERRLDSTNNSIWWNSICFCHSSETLKIDESFSRRSRKKHPQKCRSVRLSVVGCWSTRCRVHPPLVTGNGARKWRGVEPSKESAAPPFSEEGFVRKQIEKGDMLGN